jgi:hypothetical protein
MRFDAFLSRLAAAVGFSLALAFGAAAQTSDLWTVSNITVDATGTSPSAAKESALAQGRQKAWAEMFRRLTPSAEWSLQPPLTDQQLDPMIKSFTIASEKHSSTRYLAVVSYVFNPVGVRAALKRSGTRFSESTAKPVLVVPLFGSAWVPDSPWGQAWSEQSRRGRLVPVAVPVGDVEDMGSLATVSSAADWSIVRPLAERYGAGQVLVASATKGTAGLQVTLTQIRSDGRFQRSGSYAPQAGEDELALATRTAGAIADGLQEDWKRSTSVDYGLQSAIVASVAFTNLSEWISLRRTLESVRLIQAIAVEELSMGGARLRLDYVGKIEQVQTALSQTNVFLAADANGNWVLSRNASTAAAGPSPPPVP